MATTPVQDYRHIAVVTDGAIATVTMQRPEKRNALSVDHMEELSVAFRELGQDETVAVIILRGAGPVFCSGHDLGEMVGQDLAWYRHEFDVCTDLMTTIQSVPQPVIAQVQGVATAAGCQLVATCDLVVAAEDARFATPGVKIGLFCSTPMVALTRAIGPKKALEMLLTGEPITAREAQVAGLVNRVVPSATLEAATRDLATRIATASPIVVGLGKRAFYRQIDLPQDQAYAYAKEVMAHNSLLAEAQEGICAFLEKRPARWPAQSDRNQASTAG